VPQAVANGIRIEYERIGRRGHPAVVLIMGLGAQLISWDDRFCDQLAQAGLEVIRFDNRDAGLSSHLDELGAPDLLSALAGTVPPPYSLETLAEDTAALMSRLGIPAAHLVGISMGGMVAQLFAIRYPARTLTLASLLADAGGASRVMGEPEVLAELLASPLDGSYQDSVEAMVRLRRSLSGPGPFDDFAARGRAARLVQRASYPVGALRQGAAVLAAGDRTAGLRKLRMPALVVHGTHDPLIPFENGLRVHRALPGSRMLELDGVGHDLPPEAAQRVVDAIIALTRSVPR
jgi:pimeloyl-ACP methyl ester carboxylesterase